MGGDTKHKHRKPLPSQTSDLSIGNGISGYDTNNRTARDKPITAQGEKRKERDQLWHQAKAQSDREADPDGYKERSRKKSDKYREQYRQERDLADKLGKEAWQSKRPPLGTDTSDQPMHQVHHSYYDQSDTRSSFISQYQSAAPINPDYAPQVPTQYISPYPAATSSDHVLHAHNQNPSGSYTDQNREAATTYGHRDTERKRKPEMPKLPPMNVHSPQLTTSGPATQGKSKASVGVGLPLLDFNPSWLAESRKEKDTRVNGQADADYRQRQIVLPLPVVPRGKYGEALHDLSETDRIFKSISKR